MKKVTLIVTAPAGVFVPGFGGRECGGTFVVSEKEAAVLTRDGIEPLVEEQKKPRDEKPVKDEIINAS